MRALVNEGFAICKAEDEDALGPEDAPRVLELIDKLEPIMPVSSRPLLRLLRLAKQLLGPHTRPHPMALELLPNAVVGARSAYTRNHPTAAVLRADLANLTMQHHMQQLMRFTPGLSMQVLLEDIGECLAAADACDIAFGKDGTIANDLRGFVASIQAQLDQLTAMFGSRNGRPDIVAAARQFSRP